MNSSFVNSRFMNSRFRNSSLGNFSLGNSKFLLAFGLDKSSPARKFSKGYALNP